MHTIIDQFSTMYTLMTFICISIWNTVFKESSKVVVAECSYIFGGGAMKFFQTSRGGHKNFLGLWRGATKIFKVC